VVPPSKSIAIRAFAKINLDLRVLGVRPDGYHELRTVFQSIGLHDTIYCVARKGPFTVQCRAPGVPLDESNLVWTAAAALWQALGSQGSLRDVVVTIEKRIPLGAGLGGGSSNAAAVLVGLSRLWQSAIGRDDLQRIGSVAGADVPYFLGGGTALGLGRGDEIYGLEDFPAHWVVLAVPSFSIATRDAYGWFDSDRQQSDFARMEAEPSPWPARSHAPINDLEPPVVRRHPEIVAMKAAMKGSGALATAMSGSGSAVYGLFGRRDRAAAALPRLRKAGWHAILTRTLNRATYLARIQPIRLSRAGGLRG
jgi:4-diphosphocytidyl-2-C-methyl-D-erythritol kinase